MIRIIFIIIPAFILLLAASYLHPEDKVRISQDFPSSIKPGEEFIVRVNIHKTGITGLSRLQQDLPDGFTAEKVDCHGADFSFEEHSIKFSWIQMPSEDDFTVIYKVKTEKSISGRKTIYGLFVYVDDGKTQRQSLAPLEINTVDHIVATTPSPKVDRQLIAIAPEKGEYRVELTIHPNDNAEPAQFSDEIPENFTAEVIDAHESSFSFENHAAVFKWNKLPADTVFTISYLVKSGKEGPSPLINGVLLYGEETEAVNQPEIPMKETTSSEDFHNQTNTNTVEAGVIDQKAPVDIIKSIPPDKKILPVAEKGITYKVQISATQRSSVKDSYWFNSNYKINSTVELTYHEGWKKYLIGSFQAYNDASAFRKQTQEKVSDAFVVAYENGTRIPLSEALNKKSLNQ